MEDYLNGIDKDLWHSITSGNQRPGTLEQIGTTGSFVDVALQADKQKANAKKCLR